MAKNISSNSYLWMVGENAKVLSKQIEEQKGKITRMFLDEETEISFWTPAKKRGQELTDVQPHKD